jgi:hypothetical protein
MGKVREVLTGEGTKAVQSEIPGTEQERIGALERQADKLQEKRDIVAGLQDEMANIEFKIREIAHEHEAKLQVEDDPKTGGRNLVYRRGDYNIVVKQGKETVNVKIREASRGTDGDES